MLNTVYRKPKPRSVAGGRVPFSYDGVVESDAVKSRLLASTTNCAQGNSSTTKGQNVLKSAVRVHLSASANQALGPLEVFVDRVQICKMGSHDAQGAYVSVGEIRI